MGENTLSKLENNSIAVSFIVPIYNAEQYLIQCVDSILSQSYSNFEVLLIDDGSTDNSGNICDEYAEKDNRVRVFHKANGGVSSARNIGLDNSKGEWISFVDADDWLNSDYLITLFEDTEIADMTFWGMTFHYPKGSQKEVKPLEQYGSGKDNVGMVLAYLKKNEQKIEYLGYTWNKLFKASIIKEFHIRFIERLNIREDEVFTLTYASHIDSIRVKSSLSYHYRVLNTGLTSKLKTIEEYLLLIEKLEKVLLSYKGLPLYYLEENSILSYYFNAALADRLFSKSWWNLLNIYVAKGQCLKKETNIHSRMANLIFRFDLTLYQYIMACLVHICFHLRKLFKQYILTFIFYDEKSV